MTKKCIDKKKKIVDNAYSDEKKILISTIKLLCLSGINKAIV